MEITHKLTMHMDQRRLVPCIDVVQCDANTRVLELTLLSGGEAWDVPSGMGVAVAFRKSDGTAGLYDVLPDGTKACSYSGNVVRAVLAPQVLTAWGKVEVAVVIQDGDTLDRVATFPVCLEVARDPSAGQGISNDYYRCTSLADVNGILDGFDEEIDEFRGSLRAFPWTVTPSNMESYGWDTFLDLDHSYFYRISYEVPESFGLPVSGKPGVLVPFYAGTRGGESRDWPTMYLCAYPDGQTGQYYIAHVGSAATLADVHWQKIAIDPDGIWSAINALNNTGHFICFKDVGIQVDTVDNKIAISNGFVYTRDGRVDTPAADDVTRDISGAISLLVFDRADDAIKSIAPKAFADTQILIAILSRDDPTNVNANYIPGKWSVDGVVYPKDESARVDEMEEQMAAVVAKANNVGPFISFKDTILDIVGSKIYLNEGYIYARDDRHKVEAIELEPADGTTMAVIVYDLDDGIAKTVTGFDGFEDSQILIAVVALNQYKTSLNANYIPGKWSVDGVVYPQSAGAVSAETSGVAYVSTEGSDSATGGEDDPFRTIGKALASGAAAIRVAPGTYREGVALEGDGELEISVWSGSYDDDRVRIDLGTELTMSSDSATGLCKAALAGTEEDFLYKVFVSQTEDLVYSKEAGNYSFGFTAYACNLWQGDTKLVPVLTVEACKATEGTWTYDGDYVYVNGEAGTYTLADGAVAYGIHLVGLRRVRLSGIDILHARLDGALLERCEDTRIDRCSFGYSGLYTGLALVNATAVVRNCEAMFDRTDGLNIHGSGTADFIDCVSHDNGDDGISHHDASGGMVIGGEYYRNGKGGVCSPTFGCRNGINGVYVHDNAYGIYALADTDGDYPVALVTGCAIVGNDVGIRTRRYHIKYWNCVLSGNGADVSEEDGGTVERVG